MELVDLIKEFLRELNIKGLDAFFWVFITLSIILLFRHFYINIDYSKKRENDEINKNLEIFKVIVYEIKRHDLNKIGSDELYGEIINLLPICSPKLKREIMNFDLRNEENFDDLKRIVIEEFNSMKYDQNIVNKKYTDNASDYFIYHFKNSGFFNIFISAIFTFITFLTIITALSFLARLNSVNTQSKIIMSLLILYFITYIFLLISVADIILSKRFKASIFNIMGFIITGVSPAVLTYKANIITPIIACIIITIYIIFVFPKSIKKNS